MTLTSMVSKRRFSPDTDIDGIKETPLVPTLTSMVLKRRLSPDTDVTGVKESPKV